MSWDGVDSDPIDDLRRWSLAFRDANGIEPNGVLVVSPAVAAAIDRIEQTTWARPFHADFPHFDLFPRVTAARRWVLRRTATIRWRWRRWQNRKDPSWDL